MNKNEGLGQLLARKVKLLNKINLFNKLIASLVNIIIKVI